MLSRAIRNKRCRAGSPRVAHGRLFHFPRAKFIFRVRITTSHSELWHGSGSTRKGSAHKRDRLTILLLEEIMVLPERYGFPCKLPRRDTFDSPTAASRIGLSLRRGRPESTVEDLQRCILQSGGGLNSGKRKTTLSTSSGIPTSQSATRTRIFSQTQDILSIVTSSAADLYEVKTIRSA